MDFIKERTFCKTQFSEVRHTSLLLLVWIMYIVFVLEVVKNGSDGQIVLGNEGKFMEWNDCLFRKVLITEKNDTDCYQCTVESFRPSIPMSVTDWPQEFINCTESCDRATICTKAWYYRSNEEPPVQRPLCYQCENKKDEVIWFESKYLYDICPEDCQSCASLVDLSDAVKCAPMCRGHPTFCYPPKTSFGEKICYQASYWYGCDYVPIFKKSTTTTASPGEEDMEEGGNLTPECMSCAQQAEAPEQARHCAYACSSYPTYYNGTNFLQCRPHAQLEDKQNGLFLYNVPDEIIEFLHMSNASFLYPADKTDIDNKFLDGGVAKQIYRKFDIALMNRPLPYKYRMAKDDPNILTL